MAAPEGEGVSEDAGEKKYSESAETWCGLVVFFGMPLLFAWAGYVDAKLWAWFLVPLGVPSIGVAHAVGIGILIRAFTSQVQSKAPANSRVLATALVLPAVWLLFGWLTRAAMVL